MATITQEAETMLADAHREVAEEIQLGVATGELLDAVRDFIGRYVLLPGEAESTVIALWVLHTWALDAADATPYIAVTSATPRCGKTRLIETLRLLVRKAWHASSISEAALFRRVEAEHPTLLLDEVDAIFGAGPREPLRAVLNAGNRRGSTVTRAEGKGYREFPIYCAKLLAGIDNGTLPDTVRDRSIEIRMRRRDDEPVQRLRARPAEREADPLVFSLEMWALAVIPLLERIEPDLPAALSDRASDACEPLLQIADLAGADHASRARRAVEALCAPESAPQTLPPDELLATIRAYGGAP